MKYHDFIGQVQHRAKLSSEGEAVRATRATLSTLGERLGGGEAADVAAQLPEEIAIFLKPEIDEADRFDVNEFFGRVERREQVDRPDAVFHSRCVIDVLSDAVSGGEFDDIRSQLPEDYRPLLDTGSTGRMDT
ncbi:MAG: DUF2267 domain-containing protein [candidate division Zixibacteria bacterium]|nr:DUF2267 domain-containing protein [candidate division Zixibacteria bacterium]